MVFSSLTFLLYFLPLTLIIYYLLSFSIPVQNIWLLLMSLLFYTWGEPAYFWLLIVSTLINYLLGLLVGKFLDTKPKAAKFCVFADVILNIGILFIFKYMTFFFFHSFLRLISKG